MNQTLRIALVSLGVLFVVVVLLVVGVLIGRSWFVPAEARYGGMMAYSQSLGDRAGAGRYGPGMMGSNFEGYGPFSSGMMGSGMMGQGMMGGGMMGNLQAGPLQEVEPLSLEEAERFVSEYLEAFEDEDLELGEIMVFDNHAYAQIIEASTGRGAMEVLVDPVTGAVYPEHGPNMMWNLKYSPMAAGGMMGMMQRPNSTGQGFGMGSMMGSTSDEIGEEMAISEEEAVEIAQDYLNAYVTGTEAAEHADPFYGYYTIHIERDGETIGMLSVNGFSRAVWLHSWHGELLEVSNH